MPAYHQYCPSDFYCSGDYNGKNKLQCAPHLHGHIEMAQIIEGEVEGYADTDKVILHPGDFYIAFPNQVHRFISHGPEKYRIFIFSPELVPDFLQIFEKQIPRTAIIEGAGFDHEIDEICATLFRFKGYHNVGNDIYNDAVMRGALLALFGRLLPMMSLTAPRTGDTRAVREVITYCSQHFCDEISLEVLEQELHLSRYYISHLFSEKLNIRFNDYINSLRITKACNLLKCEDMPITEISEAVGFSTLRTFNRAFGKFRGMTPSEFRKSKNCSDTASTLPIYDQ